MFKAGLRPAKSLLTDRCESRRKHRVLCVFDNDPAQAVDDKYNRLLVQHSNLILQLRCQFHYQIIAMLRDIVLPKPFKSANYIGIISICQDPCISNISGLSVSGHNTDSFRLDDSSAFSTVSAGDDCGSLVLLEYFLCKEENAWLLFERCSLD